MFVPGYFDASTVNPHGALQAAKLAAVVDDCLAAMRFCAAAYTRAPYHPAKYQAAKALRALGRPTEALAELAPLFSRARAAFGLNVAPITAAGARRKATGKHAEAFPWHNTFLDSGEHCMR